MEKVTSMTEEEFSKAAREVGWDDEWIQHLIEEARIDADMEQTQQRGIIAVPIHIGLAGLWNSIKDGPAFVEAHVS